MEVNENDIVNRSVTLTQKQLWEIRQIVPGRGFSQLVRMAIDLYYEAWLLRQIETPHPVDAEPVPVIWQDDGK